MGDHRVSPLVGGRGGFGVHDTAGLALKLASKASQQCLALESVEADEQAGPQAGRVQGITEPFTQFGGGSRALQGGVQRPQ